MRAPQCLKFAQTPTEREASHVGKVWIRVYANGGSGESTRTKRLAGATPQNPDGAILKGSTSSIACGRKAVRRGVAAQKVQRMGREVHLQRSRQIPSFSV